MAVQPPLLGSKGGGVGLLQTESCMVSMGRGDSELSWINDRLWLTSPVDTCASVESFIQSPNQPGVQMFQMVLGLGEVPLGLIFFISNEGLC